jgi:Flp pilus assembly protein TadB
MPLSPHEERALAALEVGLHADDPAFAAVLAATPPARRSFRPSAMTLPRAFSLLAALGALITAGTLAGDRPVVLAAITVALLVPWLVWTARSSAHRSRTRERPE